MNNEKIINSIFDEFNNQFKKYGKKIDQGFMKPYIYLNNDISEYFDDILESDQDFNTNALCYCRLSANGYLDCTEYTPINNKDDIIDCFNMYYDMV